MFIKDFITDSLPVITGGPQGSVLKPLFIFFFFLSGFCEGFDPAIILIHFADDTVIYSSIRFIHDQSKLSRHLKNIAAWYAKWRIKLKKHSLQNNVTDKRHT